MLLNALNILAGACGVDWSILSASGVEDSGSNPDKPIDHFVLTENNINIKGDQHGLSSSFNLPHR